MIKGTLFSFRVRSLLKLHSLTYQLGKRTLLSQAYQCEEAWSKRLDSPLLKNIKMDLYFVEIDKKFGTKGLASGIDIDLYANKVQDPNQFDELEHLLYRFRMTKRSNEMLDSTICAVVRIYLKFKDYESLFRILSDQENYGIFPDEFLYNILMDHFIEQKMYREATQIAVLMMLQEDFSNEIGSFLAVYSCHQFMKNHPLDELYPKPESENKEEEDDEEILERVPFFRNPWFDDHFDLKEPHHLIGKTFFLAGRQMKDQLLGKSFHLLGLGMYEKWTAALELLQSLEKSEAPVLLSEAVEEFKKLVDAVEIEEIKQQSKDVFEKMEKNNQIKQGDFESHLNSKMGDLPALEKTDIKKQEELFNLYEEIRELSLHKQNLELDKQRRLEEIEEKKVYLFWKEKELFFFEKEDWILEEFKKAEEITKQVIAQKSVDETYVVPEIARVAPQKLTKYEKLIRVKQI